ncbi:FecR family protein [Flavitalea antarctica]
MPKDHHRLNELFQLYLSNSIQKPEYSEMLRLLDVEDQGEMLQSELTDLWLQAADTPLAVNDNIWNEKVQFLLQQINEKNSDVTPVRKISPWFKYRWVAAAFFLALSAGLYYYLNRPERSGSREVTIAKADTAMGVMPGGNKATLTLADGTSIILDNSPIGTIGQQGAANVTKLSSGQLSYNSNNEQPKELLYNLLATPLGGQFQVTLADGTLVWLNSGSTLRYPTVFVGDDRKVEITGEVYFEVAKDPLHPFKVTINSPSHGTEEVEVLGTEFNINAYKDEPMVRTTLINGIVNINSAKGRIQMKPGQQWQNGIAENDKLISNVNLEEVIAWKNGNFQFENAEIKDVMRQLARWYDIDVEYKGVVSQHFDGTLSRNVNILKVLEMLELTGEVSFKVEGRKVVVMP